MQTSNSLAVRINAMGGDMDMCECKLGRDMIYHKRKQLRSELVKSLASDRSRSITGAFRGRH